MLNVLFFLVAGIILGWFFRSYVNATKISEKLITITIFLLLFTLGLKAGADNRITSQLPTLGLTALLISLFAIGGSILVTWLYEKFFYQRKQDER